MNKNDTTAMSTGTHPISGRYKSIASTPGSSTREKFRLDVDRHYPQMVASGKIKWGISSKTNWIANLTPTGTDSWHGTIWYKDGNVTAFPYTDVQIDVVRVTPAQHTATLTFSGGGGTQRVISFTYKSPYFHRVDFEFDFAQDESATTVINTCDHPNRPATLPCEQLTIQEVYKRTGFDVTTRPGGEVPIGDAGPNARWSNQEMHDAMQTYWSRFAGRPQWAMWIFFASLHERGTGLGGIMFDDIGPNHRQGTAIFNDSFIATAPSGDPDPVAWVRRNIFWTACHEMGHGFNLAHSWQKQHPFGNSWLPISNEPGALSFMNYPSRYPMGQAAFFSDFEYRFSDTELLFMRHAPGRFVKQGKADWFDDHGFQQAVVSPDSALRLELRANREHVVYEFMEPVTLELKLRNVSSQPQLVNERILSNGDGMTVILKKDGKPARQHSRYAQCYWSPNKIALMKGETLYDSLFVSTGTNGWDIAEPGNYTVQVAINVDGEDIVSNALRVRIAPPRGYDEEFLAQDFFSDDVGRTLAFDGSQCLPTGNATLHEVATRLSDRRVALHATLALGSSIVRDYKKIPDDSKAASKPLSFETTKAQPEEAKKLLSAALTANMPAAVESFGHIDSASYVEHFSELLAQQGDVQEAEKMQDVLYQTMSQRQVHGHKVLDHVLQGIKTRCDHYKKMKH